MKQEMTWSKETKNTQVYICEKDDAIIPTLYIKKHAFKDEAPETITINVEMKNET